MNLTTEQLEQVRDMSAALMSADEIGILIGLSTHEMSSFIEICKNHIQSEIYLAFHKGRLQTKYDLRKTVIKLAKNGSPAAEPLAEKYIREQLK